jgi:hypothetical protein
MLVALARRHYHTTIMCDSPDVALAQNLRCRCTYESMLVALARYHHRGLYAIERSSAAAMDRLAVAARQLPDADREVGPGTGRTSPPSTPD